MDSFSQIKNIKLMITGISNERTQELLSLIDDVYAKLIASSISRKETTAILHCVSEMIDNTAIR